MCSTRSGAAQIGWCLTSTRAIQKRTKKSAALYSSLGPAQRRVKSNTPTSLHRLHSEMWLTGEAVAWKRPNPLRCNVRLRLHLCVFVLCPYYMTESARYMTIHAHCIIMLHKTINKIYIPLLLKTHFKPPSSVCNNFLLPSNVCFGHCWNIVRTAIAEERRHIMLYIPADSAGRC